MQARVPTAISADGATAAVQPTASSHNTAEAHTSQSSSLKPWCANLAFNVAPNQYDGVLIFLDSRTPAMDEFPQAEDAADTVSGGSLLTALRRSSADRPVVSEDVPENAPTQSGGL